MKSRVSPAKGARLPSSAAADSRIRSEVVPTEMMRRPSLRARSMAAKPSDYQAVFKGNIDDQFIFGLKFTRKSVRLFAPRMSSDIIIASPLALRRVTGVPGDKQRDFDFLSSVEVMIMDQADALSMQNFKHMEIAADVLNKIPKERGDDIDFSRVRMYCLNDWARYFRQTIVLSDYANDDLKFFMNKYCYNVTGRAVIRPAYLGSITKVALQLRQVFQRIQAQKRVTADDDRFNAFCELVLPQLRTSTDGHVLVFVPSYLDYVRVRNYFTKKRLRFSVANEYSENSEIARSRTDFYHGHTQFLLITERFHYFRRYRLRGVHHVVFYAPPSNAQFYSELLNSVVQRDINTCLLLFTKYDRLELERIVGSERAELLLGAVKATHVFT